MKGNIIVPLLLTTAGVSLLKKLLEKYFQHFLQPGRICESWNNWKDQLAILGLSLLVACVLKLSHRISSALHSHFAGAFGTKKRLRQFGDWAGEAKANALIA